MAPGRTQSSVIILDISDTDAQMYLKHHRNIIMTLILTMGETKTEPNQVKSPCSPVNVSDLGRST